MVACVEDCVLCPKIGKVNPPRYETRKNILNFDGDDDAPYLFVFEAPTKDEDWRGYPMVGNYGQQVMDIIKRAGIDRSDCAFTYANRCYQQGASKRKEQDACRPYLVQDITEHKPKVIVTFGAGPLWSVLRLEGITYQRGSVFESEFGIPVVPTFAPSALFHDPNKMEFLIADIAKARRIAEGDEFTALGDYYHTATLEEAEMLYEYIAEHDVLSFDFETSSLDPRHSASHILCASFSVKSGEGWTIPLVGQFSAEIWTARVKRKIEDIIRRILQLPNVRKIAANGKFDASWARYCLGIHVVDYDWDAQYAFAIHHEQRPHSLEHQRTIWTNMPRYESFKDMPEIRELIKQHGYAGIPTDLLWPYAAADADLTFRCYKPLVKALAKESIGMGGPFSSPPPWMKKKRRAA